MQIYLDLQQQRPPFHIHIQAERKSRLPRPLQRVFNVYYEAFVMRSRKPICKHLTAAGVEAHLHEVQSSVQMPDSNEAIAAPCHLIREYVDKCVREKGVDDCKDLIDAFQACIKTLSEGS